MQQLSAGGQRPTVTYRAELSGRALKQIHGLPSRRSTVSSRLWRKSSITRRSAQGSGVFRECPYLSLIEAV